MVTLAVPYHLDEPLELFPVGLAIDRTLQAELPAAGRWERMAVLYGVVADAVAAAQGPVLVASGDCTTSLATLAGLQRAGRDVGVVWFDAHADFHTETSTTSGYLGGMPLALAVGVGTPTLPRALGLRPIPEARAVLVDARDTDPGEHDLLAVSQVRRLRVDEIDAGSVPGGDIYLHVDIDVYDPSDVPDLLFPAPGGPAAAAVTAAVGRVLATGRVVAVGLGVTRRVDGTTPDAYGELTDLLSAYVR